MYIFWCFDIICRKNILRASLLISQSPTFDPSTVAMEDLLRARPVAKEDGEEEEEHIMQRLPEKIEQIEEEEL